MHFTIEPVFAESPPQREAAMPRACCNCEALSFSRCAAATVPVSSGRSSMPSTRQSPRLAIHLILDNYGTYKTALIQRWLASARGSMCI